MQTAKVFKNGQSQAIRLPKEFRFKGRQVSIQKVGYAVILTPTLRSWDKLLKSIERFPDEIELYRDEADYREKERF